MNINATMNDWQPGHVRLAAEQGWCLSEVAVEGSAHYLEIQRLDDAETVSKHWGVQVPQLDGDEAAVAALKQACMRGEPHAVLAYQIVKHNSPSEFYFWQMQNWQF